MNNNDKKIKAFSHDTKYEIIRKAEDGVKTGKLSQDYNIAKSTIIYPANCTSLIQPMDQGIINTVKVKYKKQVVP